jgi:Spy/CpxP family protein refolding chaperone
MMIMKTKILSFALLLMLALGVNAQPGNQVTGPGMKNHMPIKAPRQEMAKALNLTNEQKEASKKIMLASHKEIQPVRNEIGEVTAHMKTLISADKPDFAAIDKSIEKIGALKTEVAKIALKSRLEIRALLTDEQRMKAEGMKAKAKQSMGQKKGRPGMALHADPQRMAKQLNLTDEQKEAIKKIMMSMPKEIKPLRNELGEAAAHQKTLMSADQPNIDAINKNLDKMSALKIKMAKIRTKGLLEMRAQLTDEQRFKAEAIKAMMKRSMGQKFGKQGLN